MMEPGRAGEHLRELPSLPGPCSITLPGQGGSEGERWDSRQMLGAPDCSSLAYQEKFLLPELLKPLLLACYFH